MARILRIWYVVMIMSVLQLVTYGLTGYVANVYRSLVWEKFNENTQIFHDVDQQVPCAEIINRYAHDVGINPQVIAAVIQVESSFQPRAVSAAGAYGLMQIMPDTWRQVNQKIKACVGRHKGECSSECYYNADLNIQIGTNYLSELLVKYQGNMTLALAAYNAGPGAVEGYGGMPPYDETIKYTGKIVDNFYSMEKSNTYYLTVSRVGQWDKAHKLVGWCLVMTVVVGVLIVWRLFRHRSSWYWR